MLQKQEYQSKQRRCVKTCKCPVFDSKDKISSPLYTESLHDRDRDHSTTLRTICK